MNGESRRKNVSLFGEKEDAFQTEEELRKEIVSRETILSGTNFAKLYRLFRNGGLKRFESAYNAYYVLCHNKYEASEKAIKKKYKSVPEHPHEWASDKKKTHKKNFWGFSLATMNFTHALSQGVKKTYRKFVSTIGKIARIPANLDSSHKAFRILKRLFSGAVLPLFAAAIIAYTAFAVASGVNRDYAVGVYVDGEYVGCTENVNEVLSIKRTYEKKLTERFGAQAVLKCNIDFVPEKADKDRVILPGDTSIFDGYLQNYIKDGYGLYIDGKLAAVTDTEIWLKSAVDDFLEEQKRSFFNYYSVNAAGEDEILLNNNITIISDKYPSDFFLSRTEIRELFSLPVFSDEDDDSIKERHLHFIDWENFERRASEKVSFNYSIDYNNVLGAQNGDGGGNGVVSAMAPSGGENVSVDIVFARNEVEKIAIPYETVTVDDPNMRKGLRRLKTPGENGEKTVTSRVTYMKGKKVKVEVIGEEITKEPVNKIVRVGTREPVEGEEDAYLPTGTYIYPYKGRITSLYGWRVFGGSYNFHQGLDICGPKGDPVVAADAGEVIDVGVTRGYGNYVLIRHDEDTVTRYAHCDEILVEVGDSVAQGSQIATLGSTGNATGVHVHFEIIINGSTVDPLPYMAGEQLEILYNY